PLGYPARPEMPLLVAVLLRPPTKLHIDGDFRAHDLPWIPESEPLVGDLNLPTIANHLIEDAEFVAKAVTDRRHIERGHGVHVTGGEPAEPTIAQARFLFLFEEDRQVLIELSQRLLGGVPDAEIDQAVAEM